MEKKASAEKAVREIRRKTRRRFSAEEKIRIVIEGAAGRGKHRLTVPPCSSMQTSS
jgi:transposase-like protein